MQKSAGKNKVAVITGASSGIGFATAKKLAEEGYSLALVSRTLSKASLAALTKKFRVRVKWYACDVTQGEQILRTAREIVKDVSRIDVLVNAAGGSTVTAPTDTFDEAFDKDIAVNLRGTHLCCKLFSPYMKKGGAIINVSSQNGRFIVFPSAGVKMGYAAAKAAVIQLTKAYAIELADRGIRVNAVAPGPIFPTGMTKDWDKAKQGRVVDKTPLKRLGTPEDIANAVWFLASDLSSYVTGHTLDVNGGSFMN